MKGTFAVAALTVGFLLLQGCGTTSGLKPEADAREARDLSAYDRVVVLAFTDQTDTTRIRDARRQEQHRLRVATAGRTFADMIANEIRLGGAFSEVLTEPTDQPAIVVSGTITRFQEGSAFARAMIGLGAGSSYFDAAINLADESGAAIGNMATDRNSWVLGGAIAAGQTVEHFMQAAAKRVADELKAAKTPPRM